MPFHLCNYKQTKTDEELELDEKARAYVETILRGKDAMVGTALSFIPTKPYKSPNVLSYAKYIQKLCTGGGYNADRITILDFSPREGYSPILYCSMKLDAFSMDYNEIIGALDIFNKLCPNIDTIILGTNVAWYHITLLAFVKRFPNLRLIEFEKPKIWSGSPNFPILNEYYPEDNRFLIDLCTISVERHIAIVSNMDVYTPITEELNRQIRNIVTTINTLEEDQEQNEDILFLNECCDILTKSQFTVLESAVFLQLHNLYEKYRYLKACSKNELKHYFRDLQKMGISSDDPRLSPVGIDPKHILQYMPEPRVENLSIFNQSTHLPIAAGREITLARATVEECKEPCAP